MKRYFPISGLLLGIVVLGIALYPTPNNAAVSTPSTVSVGGGDGAACTGDPDSGLGASLGLICQPQYTAAANAASTSADLSVQVVPRAGVATADPQATPTTQRVLNYLYTLRGNHTLSGQYNRNNDWQTPYSGKSQSVAQACSPNLPAIGGGGDTSWLSHDEPVWAAQWNSGGLVFIMLNYSFPNGTGPDSGRGFNFLSHSDVVQLTTPGTSAYAQLHNAMDVTINGALIPLRDAGATVIIRPYWEMNGNWTNYYSGSMGDADFALLWQDAFTYLTTNKGLHNLLFHFSPNGGVGGYTTGFRSQYVDVVGLDWYTSQPTFVPGYNELAATGKPILLGEIATNDASSTYDWSAWPGIIQSQMPLTVGIMGWWEDSLVPGGRFPGFNCSQYLESPRMINLGGVHY